MQYSVLLILHPYANKDAEHKINIQLIYQRKKVYAPTNFKVTEDQWQNGLVIKHPNKKHINDLLSEKRNNIEKRLIDAIRIDPNISKEQLNKIAKEEKAVTATIEDFIYTLLSQLNGKLSEGRLKHFKSIAKKIEEYSPAITFSSISVAWLNAFEKYIRGTGIDSNTVHMNMKIFKSILFKALEAGLLDEKQFKGYKLPSYKQKVVEYLNEEEIGKIRKLVDAIEKPGMKMAGYYFLLSCYTGYRISDAKRFNYEEMVRDDKIILRAAKNDTIVSIPIYERLRGIIEYVKDHPLTLSEQKIRDYIKEISSLVDIKKHVKYHTSRHSFAMMLIDKGFSIDEVAQMLGDSADVAKVYARISNTHLSKKVIERLG